MDTHQAKRVAIIIEAPMRRRLEEAFDSAGVTGYTVVPVLGGSGRSGRLPSLFAAGRIVSGQSRNSAEPS